MACKSFSVFYAIYHVAFLYRILDFTHNLKKSRKLFTAAAPFAEAVYPSENPLPVTALADHTLLWVEPISVDEYLKNELRGYYHVKQQYVENDAGNRFLFNSYGVKWLAFEYQSE